MEGRNPNHFFHVSEEGAKIEAPPAANCNRCAHFRTCGIWRICAGVEQQYGDNAPLLVEFLKTLPRICPQYEVKVENLQ